jgi:tRNA (guanine-N7-)-methyltransferase
VTETGPRYQFYGRRKGHALRRHHLELVEKLLPRIRFDPASLPATDYRETWLEIGFGGGEHLANLAARHPEVLCIGAEPFINGVAKLLALIEEKRLDNIRIHDGDARYLLEALPASSLARLYLLYPDPWPKIRHHKRRFINRENLRQIHRVLVPGGMFIFASDIAEYVDWTLEHIRNDGGFSGPDRDMNQPPADWVETRYENKAKAAGRNTTYLRFQKA